MVYAKILQETKPEELTAANKEWLADFVVNIPKVFEAERELDAIVAKRAITPSKFLSEPQPQPSTSKSVLIEERQIRELPPFPRQPPSQDRPVIIPAIKLNELVLRPDKCDGKREIARLWLEDYETASLANGWTEMLMYKYFSTFLTQSARNWFAAIAQPRLSVKPNASWLELRTMFVRYFIGPEEQENIRRELRRCRQRKDETSIEFISRVMRLIKIAEPDLIEKEQVREIRLKLRDNYQDRLIGLKPETIEELNDVCLEVEERLEAFNNRKQFGQRNIGKKANDNNNKNGGYKPNREKVTNSNDKPKARYHCSFCKKDGHTIERCWAKNGKPGDNKQKAGTTAVVGRSQPQTNVAVHPAPKVSIVRTGTCGGLM